MGRKRPLAAALRPRSARHVLRAVLLFPVVEADDELHVVTDVQRVDADLSTQTLS